MAKRGKTDTQQIVATSVGIIPGGQPVSAPFSRGQAVRAYSSWIFAATMINANAIAATPLRLYAKRDASRKAFRWWKGCKVPAKRKRYLLGRAERSPSAVVRKAAMESDDFEEIADHPAARLLNDVNPWTAGFDHLRLTAIYLQAVGDAFWFADRSGVGGVPSTLVQMPPQWTQIIPDQGTLIQGYLYGRDRGTAIRLETDEVVHFKEPNPRNIYYGTGWYEAAWAAINQNVAVHEMDLAFFANFARPDYLVTIQGNAQDDALKRFQEEMQASNGGTKKVGRLLAATGQVDIKPLNFQPKDMNGRDEIVEEIAAISGVPVSLMKANDPNLASAEVGFRSWREGTILPKCRMMEAVLNQLYLPMWGIDGDAFFAFDDPVPDNAEATSIVVDRKIRNGSLTLNEARGEDGYEEYETPLASVPLFNGQPLGASVAAMATDPMPQGDSSIPDSVDFPDTETDDIQETPDAPDAPGTAPAAAVPATETAVQDTALNGAQVSALVDLIVQVRSGVVPVDAAQAIAAAAFPLMTPEQIAAIFAPLRSAGVIEPPEPEPTPPPAGGNPPETPEGSEKSACSCCAKEGQGGDARTFRQSDFLPQGTVTKATDPLEEMSDRKVRAFVRSLEPVLQEQAVRIVARLEEVGTASADILDILRNEIQNQRWVERIATAARPHIGDMLTDGAAEGVRLLPPELREMVRFEFVNPEVSRYIDNATTRLASAVNQTTEVRVRDILGQSLEQGRTVQQMAQEIQQTLGVTGDRAETIARTESARAYVQGQEEAWKQSGVVVGKTWLLAPDACEFCRAAARQFAANPVPLGQPFYKMGDTLAGVSGGTMILDYSDVDGPPLHPRCRCAERPVLEGER